MAADFSNARLPFLTWTDLQEVNIAQYLCCQSRQTKLSLIEEWLGLDANARQTPIVTDHFYHALHWAEQQSFNAPQMSTFFSFMKHVHNMCIGTHLDNLDEMARELHDLVLLHSVEKPPTSIGLFSTEQSRNLFNYILETYFRHYKLYKYAFTAKYTMDLTLRYDDEPEPEAESAQEDLSPLREDNGDDMTEVDGAPGSPTKQEEEEDAADAGRSAAENELRSVIDGILREHMKKLDGDVEAQMKTLEAKITQQLTTLAGAGGKKGGK